MFIILEGPDGSGKSTLAKKISKQTGYEIHHFSYPKSEEEKSLMFDMYLDFIRTNDNVILDRAWYSEIVYGSIVRNGSAIDISEMNKLEKAVAEKSGGIIIHCNDNLEALWGRFSARGDDYIDVEKSLLASLSSGYEVLLDDTHHVLPVVCYAV